MPSIRSIALLFLITAILAAAIACGGSDATGDPARDAAIIAAMPVTRLTLEGVLTLDTSSTTYGEALQSLRDEGFQDVSVVTINEVPVAHEPVSAAPVWLVKLAGSDPDLGCGAYDVVVDEDGRAFVWARQSSECPDSSDVGGRDRALLAAGTRFVIPGPAVSAVDTAKSRFLDATQRLDELGFDLQPVTSTTPDGETSVWLITFESATPDVALEDVAPTPEALELAACSEVAQVIDAELAIVLAEASRQIDGCS